MGPVGQYRGAGKRCGRHALSFATFSIALKNGDGAMEDEDCALKCSGACAAISQVNQCVTDSGHAKRLL
jgi:hypothetical protein